MQNQDSESNAMDAINRALEQSSIELKKLVRFYQQLGRRTEAREINDTLDRMNGDNSEHRDKGLA